MRLSAADLLSANCPRCFGPTVTTTAPSEPDVIVCLNGNFQHRRHAAASVPIPGHDPPLPELFLPKYNWEQMAVRIGAHGSVYSAGNGPDVEVVSVKL